MSHARVESRRIAAALLAAFVAAASMANAAGPTTAATAPAVPSLREDLDTMTRDAMFAVAVASADEFAQALKTLDPRAAFEAPLSPERVATPLQRLGEVFDELSLSSFATRTRSIRTSFYDARQRFDSFNNEFNSSKWTPAVRFNRLEKSATEWQKGAAELADGPVAALREAMSRLVTPTSTSSARAARLTAASDPYARLALCRVDPSVPVPAGETPRWIQPADAAALAAEWAGGGGTDGTFATLVARTPETTFYFRGAIGSFGLGRMSLSFDAGMPDAWLPPGGRPSRPSDQWQPGEQHSSAERAAANAPRLRPLSFGKFLDTHAPGIEYRPEGDRLLLTFGLNDAIDQPPQPPALADGPFKLPPEAGRTARVVLAFAVDRGEANRILAHALARRPIEVAWRILARRLTPREGLDVVAVGEVIGYRLPGWTEPAAAATREAMRLAARPVYASWNAREEARERELGIARPRRPGPPPRP